MLRDPLVFEPYLRPQIWGGRRLEARLGKRLPTEGTYGESWEISAHPHHISRVAEGPLKGRQLTDLWPELRGASDAESFPWLIKFLDCCEPLSVQVHPSDELARELLGESCGKTEAWVILDAEPTARIYAGLRSGVTRSDLEHHLERGTVGECLHEIEPRPGDCFFLPAGTVHAIGGGVMLAEVQQSSDATFRLFDWNRLGPDGQPRPLHIAESLRSIDWSAGPVKPATPIPLENQPHGVQGERLVACRYFEWNRYRLTSDLPVQTDDSFSVWMILDGPLRLRSRATGYLRDFQVGETVLIPGAAEGLVWLPVETATLLQVRRPNKQL